MGINWIKLSTGETLVDLRGDTVAPGKMLAGTIAHNAEGEEIEGTIATTTQATPSISVSSAGKITATSTQSAGYVAAGTKTATKNLTTQAAKTVTPTTSNQTAVASGRYTTGAVMVAGDANLVPTNIVSGKSIFGVAGTATAGEDLSAEITQYGSLNDELEEVINSLPDAGEGGGATLQVAEGTFTPTNTSLKSYPITISGLPFKPKMVYIQLQANGANVYTGGLYGLTSALFTDDGIHKLTCTLKGSMYSQINYDDIDTTINNDGFTLSSTSTANSAKIIKKEYAYVAFG